MGIASLHPSYALSEHVRRLLQLAHLLNKGPRFIGAFEGCRVACVRGQPGTVQVLEAEAKAVNGGVFKLHAA
jgi:hypothetical protein